jgi:hypothetical protein
MPTELLLEPPHSMPLSFSTTVACKSGLRHHLAKRRETVLHLDFCMNRFCKLPECTLLQQCGNQKEPMQAVLYDSRQRSSSKSQVTAPRPEPHLVPPTTAGSATVQQPGLTIYKVNITSHRSQSAPSNTHHSPQR